jgi:hypothetical protein
LKSNEGLRSRGWDSEASEDLEADQYLKSLSTKWVPVLKHYSTQSEHESDVIQLGITRGINPNLNPDYPVDLEPDQSQLKSGTREQIPTSPYIVHPEIETGENQTMRARGYEPKFVHATIETERSDSYKRQMKESQNIKRQEHHVRPFTKSMAPWSAGDSTTKYFSMMSTQTQNKVASGRDITSPIYTSDVTSPNEIYASNVTSQHEISAGKMTSSSKIYASAATLPHEIMCTSALTTSAREIDASKVMSPNRLTNVTDDTKNARLGRSISVCKTSSESPFESITTNLSATYIASPQNQSISDPAEKYDFEI